ncbi:MAG: hypothetical protein E6Q97_20740 [Desulfurellales bacterium]|nr:MAG: hypothetical protein E6Q97_20740 [Desulfurellales bacterium]
MQIKTIKSVLAKKIQAWANSVQDETVKKIIQEQTVVTGGAIASMLLQESVNDFDVYFRTPEGAFAVAQYYVKKMNEVREKKATKGTYVPLYVADFESKAGIDKYEGKRFIIVAESAGVAEEEQAGEYQYFEVTDPEGVAAEAYLDDVKNAAEQKAEESKNEFRPIFMSSNAITLSDKIQIVIRFSGEPNEIHANYDFVHCMCSWTSWNRELTTPQEALHAMMSRTLTYIGSLYPVCSVIRTRKFIQRGWRITAGQYLKMAFQIADLNLRDVRVLEDQLTGVDSAFFYQLISIVRKDVEEGKKPEDIDVAYISQLVDRIF